MPGSARRIEVESIHDTLRDRVCLLDYPPGTVLREGELAAEFGVSRTPIREVLQRLAFAGLVESRNGVGTIVTTLESGALRDIYAIRLRIAVLIGDMAPGDCAPGDVERFRRLLARARLLLERFDIREYWRINHETHFTIAGLIGNRPLREMWDRYYFQAARFWYEVVEADPGDAARSLCRELEETLEAAADNDVAAIGYIQRNYIARGLGRLAPGDR